MLQEVFAKVNRLNTEEEFQTELQREIEAERQKNAIEQQTVECRKIIFTEADKFKLKNCSVCRSKKYWKSKIN